MLGMALKLRTVDTRSRRAQRKLVLGIHVENADCRSANGGLSSDTKSAPFDMSVPMVVEIVSATMNSRNDVLDVQCGKSS